LRQEIWALCLKRLKRLNEFLSAIAVVYFILMLVVFLLSARHFIGWFTNSTPPLGKLGPFIEEFSMFFDRYLTKDGVEHKNKCLRLLGICLIMGVVWGVGITIFKNNI